MPDIVRVRLCGNDRRDCASAPPVIVSALRERVSKSDGTPINFAHVRFEEIHVDLEDLSGGHALIFENGKELFSRNFRTVCIGGDHQITYSLLRAFIAVEERPFVIVVDSGADCAPGALSAESWLRHLLEKEMFSNIVLVSARRFSSSDRDFLKKHRIVVISMEVLTENIHEMCDMLMERAHAATGSYVSIDMSCVDPAFAPGVSKGEPGGLQSRELLYMMKRLSLVDTLKGVDIVEVNPTNDRENMTVGLAARVLADVL